MFDFFVRHADVSQILIFAFAVTILWLVEHVVISLPEGEKLRHTRLNVLFIATALPAELVLSVVCLWASHWVTKHEWGLVSFFPDPTNPWVKYGLVFIALDLCDYIYHRLMHHLPPLWRFHLVHHTDQMVDSSTTVREHPGETILRGGFLVVWTLLLGASFEVLLFRQAAETVSAILAHSAIRLPRRLGHVVGYVFITPNLHHVHHHCLLPYTDKNFGGVFSVWDRLFGTFAELDENETVFGLDTHMDSAATQGFRTLVTMPFRPADVAAGNAVPAQAEGSLSASSSSTKRPIVSFARSALHRSHSMIASRLSKVTWMSSFTST